MNEVRRRQAGLLAVCLGALAIVFSCTAPEPPVDDGAPVACVVDDDCASQGLKKYCVGGICDVAARCETNADCPGGLVCNPLTLECETDPNYNPPDGGEDPRDPPDGGGGGGGDCGVGCACTSKFDCDDGLICKNGKCAAPGQAMCASDSDCPRGTICNFSGQCEEGCTSQRDCESPELCHPTKFVCEKCSLTNPCPSGSSCIGGACQQAVACNPSSGARDCVEANMDGAVCIRTGSGNEAFCGNCSGHADCRVAPYSGGNAQTQRVCAQDGLCRLVECNDQKCRNDLGNRGYCDTTTGQCATYQCLSDADCGTGACDLNTHTCTTGGSPCTGQALTKCQNDCSMQSDPMTGMPLSCNTATCACSGGGGGFGCVTDADCGPGQACALGICSGVPISDLTGQPCTTFDCLFGCTDPSTGIKCDSMMCMMSGMLFGSIMCF